jgi:hypothetical protein
MKKNTYALVVKEIKARPTQIFPTIKFFVFSQRSETVIFKDVLPQGKVSWVNNFDHLSTQQEYLQEFNFLQSLLSEKYGEPVKSILITPKSSVSHDNQLRVLSQQGIYP